MRYKSTRGGENDLSFAEAVLSGLAADGGLFVPEAIPKVDSATISKWRSLDYTHLSYEVFRMFISKKEISDCDLWDLTKSAFKNFRNKEIAPVVNLSDSLCLLELFHGPTFAFKDLALQFLGPLFSFLLRREKRRSVVLGATSGDTGSAAIAGFKGLPNVDCVILFPKGRTSPTQQLQMTTILENNIRCLEIEGTFDDCQNIVKQCFTSSLKAKLNLGSVNSINFARILAQIVYYWYASFRVLDERKEFDLAEGKTKVDFVVPTGNFGNILSGHYARRMGAQIRHLVIASNSNDILTRFRGCGTYKLRPVVATESPSMDIQVSSNFERFIYEATGEDSVLVNRLFANLATSKTFSVSADVLKKTQIAFQAFSASEEETASCIRDTFMRFDSVVDPHTAVGLVAAKKFVDTCTDQSAPCVVLATAHFGKFQKAVERALGQELSQKLPLELSSLQGLPQRYETLPADQMRVDAFLCGQYDP